MNYCNDSRNIGRSSGCATWIVNRHDPQKLVPIGSIGELVIEGPTVGRGYLNDPKKTAAVFLHTPRWLKRFRHDESRVYKTGDLVQYLPDGSIKYVLFCFCFSTKFPEMEEWGPYPFSLSTLGQVMPLSVRRNYALTWNMTLG